MSKFYLQHPEDDQLLAYSDGELKGLAATRLRKHLKDCWRCRTQLEDLQAAVTGFMRYKEHVLEAQLPEPPASWRNLKVEFERIDRTVPAPRFGDRMVARYGMPAVRVASVAAVLAVTGMGYIVVRQLDPAPTGAPTAVHEASPVALHPPAVRSMTPPLPQANPQEKKQPAADAANGNAEVKVVVALNRIGADLGEPVEWSRDERGQVIVTGTALGGARRAEIQAALAGIPGVHVKFDEGKAAKNPARAMSVIEGGRLPWQTDLEQALGGKAAVETFGNTVLDLSDAVVSRAHAIRKLDERFASAQLEPAERAEVDAIVAKHRAELSRSAADLRKRLGPVLAKLGTGIGTPGAKWPLLTAARQSDQWLNVIFAGAATDRNLEQAASELGRALGSLED
jgi:anti-sigma factor RsiW